MMNKKQLLIDYLDSNLFLPIMSSCHTSSQLKHNFEHTRTLLKQFSAEGILNYVWIILGSSESEKVFSHRLVEEGFYDYNQVLNEFKQEFTYDWLLSS